MKKINLHIEIVSSTKGVLSSMSKKSRHSAQAVLSKHYVDVRITIVNNFSDLEALVTRRPDLVFLGMKFVPLDDVLSAHTAEKIWIAKYLDEHNIAYTGSNHLANELERNKPMAKQRVLDAGLATSAFFVAPQSQPKTNNNMALTFPLFIKPTDRGGGLGIDSDSVVHTLKQVRSKVGAIANRLQSDSLIEEYLPGREFSVAILKNEYTNKFLVMPIEKVAPEDKHGERLLSERVKSSDVANDLEVTDKVIRASINELALNVFHALGAQDYGRIDIRLDKSGNPHFLEANLLPSIIEGYGSFPKACFINVGMDYESMLLRIVRLALARNIHVINHDQAVLPAANLEPSLT